jgi:hypothetical protein
VTQVHACSSRLSTCLPEPRPRPRPRARAPAGAPSASPRAPARAGRGRSARCSNARAAQPAGPSKWAGNEPGGGLAANREHCSTAAARGPGRAGGRRQLASGRGAAALAAVASLTSQWGAFLMPPSQGAPRPFVGPTGVTRVTRQQYTGAGAAAAACRTAPTQRHGARPYPMCRSHQAAGSLVGRCAAGGCHRLRAARACDMSE